MPDGRVTCLICGKELATVQSGTRHYALKHQDNQPANCQICKKEFKNKLYRDDHYRKTHGISSTAMKNTIKPPGTASWNMQIMKTFRIQLLTPDFIAFHFNPVVFSEIQVLFDNLSELEEYGEDAEEQMGLAKLPDGKVTCLVCGTTLSCLASGNRHYVLKHQDNQPAKCKLCHKDFKNQMYRDRHYAKIHGISSEAMKNTIKPPSTPSWNMQIAKLE